MTTKNKKQMKSNPENSNPRQPKQPNPPPRKAVKRCRRPDQPTLRFTPYAWAKLHTFCHAGDTEIGGFGLSAPNDPLLVMDFLTVKQEVTCVSVEFDDEAVAKLFEDQVDTGNRPEQFARIWCHTHPGDSPHPSGTDEETFSRVFGGCDWAIMFILAKGGQTYARLRFRAGPGGDVEIPVFVDYAQPFPGTDHAAWEDEYDAHIHPEVVTHNTLLGADDSSYLTGGGYGAWADGSEWDHAWDGEDDTGGHSGGGEDLFDGLDLIPPFDPQDLEQDREQIELLMDEYGVSEIAELRAILQHENQALLEQCG